MKYIELESWRRATLVTVTLALFIFVLQRFVVQTFDLAFEVSIFHIPAGTLVLLYAYFRNRLRRSSVKRPA